MEIMNSLEEALSGSLKSIFADIASAFPKIIGVMVILLIGWIIHKIVRAILKKIFKVVKIEKISEKINEAKLFGDSDVKVDLSKILLGFVKGVLLLMFVIIAADFMGMTIISTEIANLLRYLPVLLSAMAIFMIGLYGAKLVKKALERLFNSMGISGAKIVSSIASTIIVIFVTITALNHAKIDTTIVTSNFTLVLGAFLLAFAIGFGLGSRQVVDKLLKTFYARKNYTVGDKIKFNDIEGTVENIDAIFVTLKTKKGKLVIPIDEIIEHRVEVE